MPRRARNLVGGYPYHVLNRANGRLRLFRKPADFAAFEAVVHETIAACAAADRSAATPGKRA